MVGEQEQEAYAELEEVGGNHEQKSVKPSEGEKPGGERDSRALLANERSKQNTDTYLFLKRDNDRSFANTSLNIMRVYNTYISSTHTRLLNKEQRIAHLCSSPDWRGAARQAIRRLSKQKLVAFKHKNKERKP